jgi:hypothetical protein
MVDQTAMNNLIGRRSNGMLDGVGSFSSNLAALAGLQARLVACDFREAVARSAAWLFALAAAGLLLAGSVTIGLAGIALWISAALDLTPATTLMITALGTILFGLVAGTLALGRLRANLAIFRRSQEEFQRNLAWIGTVLSHSGR